MMKTTTFLFLLLSVVANAPAQTFDKAKLDQFLDRLAYKNKGMGSLVLAKDGEVVYSRSFGYGQIHVDEKKPLTAETKYRIASITKMYTGVMIFQLVEEGKLKLSDTLDKFFPQIPNASRITISHMLMHRSGIADLKPDGSFAMQPRTQNEVLARLAQGTPEFQPDAEHRYSNAGYILLGYIVEIVGGKPYQDALRQRITSRLGLSNTYLGVGRTDPSKNEALSYRYIGAWKEAAEIDFSVPAGAGAILSTPAEMAKFIQALFDGKLVSNDNLKKMSTMRESEGMGMESFSLAGKTLYGHTGGTGSSGAWLAYMPEEKLALAYTTNAKIYPVKNIIEGALDIYWNRPFQVPAFNTLEVSAETLDRYVGVYTIAGTPARATITREGTTLHFQPGAQSSVPLEAIAENKFRIEPFLEFEFDAAKGALTLTRAGQKRVFKKQE